MDTTRCSRAMRPVFLISGRLNVAIFPTTPPTPHSTTEYRIIVESGMGGAVGDTAGIATSTCQELDTPGTQRLAACGVPSRPDAVQLSPAAYRVHHRESGPQVHPSALLRIYGVGVHCGHPFVLCVRRHIKPCIRTTPRHCIAIPDYQ